MPCGDPASTRLAVADVFDGNRIREADLMTANSGPDAMLVLEDGTTLRGKGFGASGESFG